MRICLISIKVRLKTRRLFATNTAKEWQNQTVLLEFVYFLLFFKQFYRYGFDKVMNFAVIFLFEYTFNNVSIKQWYQLMKYL